MRGVTNTIYAGTTKGCIWGEDTQDVTIDALVAVAKHVENFGEPVVITLADGTPEYHQQGWRDFEMNKHELAF